VYGVEDCWGAAGALNDAGAAAQADVGAAPVADAPGGIAMVGGMAIVAGDGAGAPCAGVGAGPVRLLS